MLTFALLLGQLSMTSARPDSFYSSAALHEFINDAATANHAPPAAIRSYRARLETELSFILRDTLGRERVTQVEQLASSADWDRSGRYDLHVIGYRFQSIGAPFSALSFVRSWTVPALYGDRLELGLGVGSQRQRGTSPGSGGTDDTVKAVHPLAADREGFYRYSNGDTVAVLHTTSGTIPIVRVRVRPVPHGNTRVVLFDGELDFDATRHALVRMRGTFVAIGPPRRDAGWQQKIVSHVPGLTAVAFIEFVNAQLEGEYWLPSVQRTELVAGFALTGEDRSIIRIMSRFTDYDVAHSATVAADSSAPRTRTRVTFAPGDSLNHYGRWEAELGAMTANAKAQDFEDLTPNVWRKTGPPVFQPFPKRLSEIVRFNRVEGLYTGGSAALRMRDAAPGLSIRGYGGWAWTEETARGGVAATLDRQSWSTQVRAERLLGSTNDFTTRLGGGSSLGALIGGVDDADYVDRWLASVSTTHVLGSLDRALAEAELGVASDRSEVTRLRSGLLRARAPFRMNRRSTDGSYLRFATSLELHPNVTGDFLEPGIGSRLRFEAGAGQLTWQRAEIEIAARQYWNGLSFAAHADGGVVLARTPPPQTMFELGGNEGLPGYGYKEFGGDQAALVRAMTGYRFPVLTTPLHLPRGYVVPGLSPGLAFGVQGGWTGVSGDAARRALQLLTQPDSTAALLLPFTTSRPTGGVRATVDARATLFGGTIGIGVARPVDHAAPWQFVFSVGQTF
jgi:hypothetical protein